MNNSPTLTNHAHRTPFFSPLERKIFGWYAYTVAMSLLAFGCCIVAFFCLFYTNNDLPAGGLTLLWRTPLFVYWLGLSLAVWYKVVKFWDPNDVKWVDDLLTRLRLR